MLVGSPPSKPALCDGTFGVLLGIGRETQRSRHDWLSETIRAERAFSRWIESGELEVFDYIFGTHSFATPPNGSGNRFAFAVRCQDEAKCRAFTGLYARIDVDARPEVFCGSPPGSSSGNFFDQKRALARTPTHPHGTCGRLRACSAFLERSPPDCDGFERSARRCLAMADCEQTLECFSAEPRNPKRKLWSDAGPPPSSDGSPSPGAPRFSADL